MAETKEMTKNPFGLFENSIVVLGDDETYSELDSTHVILPKNKTAANYIQDIRLKDILNGDWESVNADLLDDEEVPMLSEKDYEVVPIKFLVQFYISMKNKEATNA